MKKICNIIIILLVISAIILGIWIINRYMQNCQNEKNKQTAMSQIQEQIETVGENEEQLYIEYEGYQVIGIIKIEKINLEYPILNVTTEDSMKKSITKFWGDKINQIGNITLAGHNNFDGTMFRKNKKIGYR